MSILVKGNKNWQKAENVLVKSEGGWKNVKSGWVKHTDGWKKIYPRSYSIDIIVTESRGPLIVNTELIQSGWNKEDVVNTTITIDKGVSVTGVFIYNNTNMFMPQIPNDSVITIINNGIIEGARGLPAEDLLEYAKSLMNTDSRITKAINKDFKGFDGLPGIIVEYNTTIINNGEIKGGEGSGSHGKRGNCTVGNKFINWKVRGNISGVLA